MKKMKKMKKKVKKYAEGGLAGLAETAEALMGDVDNMANTINYGSSTPLTNNKPFDPGAIGSFKKGGTVKRKNISSSASKKADGIATKGKTKGRFI